MTLLTLNQLTGHDVYEFCYNTNYPNNWNKDSLFINSDDIVPLSSYFDKVFPNFHYYGPQKITISEWNSIKDLCLLDCPKYYNFFNEIDNWLNHDPQKCNFFWILGI